MAQWLKLDTNILNDEKIDLIRQMPEGDTLFTLWVGLLCLAMKKETDCLYIAEDVPYHPENLATIFHIPIDTIRLGLTVFGRFRMIAILDDGAIHITHLQDHQALDKLDRKRLLTADRMRRYRQRLALQAPSEDVTRNGVTVTLTEEEVESEEEVEKNTIVESKPRRDVAEMTRTIITYLNERADTRYNPEADGHRKLIAPLLKKGYSLEDLKKAVAIKVYQWKDDAKWSHFLRPSTLFRPSHIDDYIGEFDTEKAHEKQ